MMDWKGLESFFTATLKFIFTSNAELKNKKDYKVDIFKAYLFNLTLRKESETVRRQTQLGKQHK